MSETRAWAWVCYGVLHEDSVRRTRHEAIKFAEEMVGASWRQLYREGDRIVRVRIVREEARRG